MRHRRSFAITLLSWLPSRCVLVAMVALQVKRIPGGAVLMFLIELAFGNLFDNFLRRGRSSVIVGVLLFDPCVWPVSHARSGSAGISNHKEFVFWVLPVSLGPMEAHRCGSNISIQLCW